MAFKSLESSFKSINADIERFKSELVEQKFNKYCKIIEASAINSTNGQYLESTLNRQREEMFERLDAALKKNMFSSGKKTPPDRFMNDRVYFKMSQLTFKQIGLLGRVRINSGRSVLKTVRLLHLNNALITRSYNLQAKHITQPLIQITGFNWLRQSPKADFLIPCAENKIFYVYNFDTLQTYRFKVANPRDSPPKKAKGCHVEYEFNYKMKLEYCRFDYHLNRVALFFEKTYDREYTLKMYALADLTRPVCVRRFDHFVENFIFNKNDIISWSSHNYPFVRFFTSELNEQVTKTGVVTNYDPVIFTKYYAFADCSATHLVFHNKDTIGVVDRVSGRVTCEIDTKLYEDVADTVMNELHQQRMRAYQSQSKSEYFNVKCVLDDCSHLLVSTWSKVYVLSMIDGTLLAKNDIHLIPNNVWLLPNRLYVNGDGDIVFFDTSTSFLSFI
jgi:hypothetical protein